MMKRADKTRFWTGSVTGSAVGRVLMTVAVLGAGPVAAEGAGAGVDAKAAEAFVQLLEAYRAQRSRRPCPSIPWRGRARYRLECRHRRCPD